MTLRLAACQIQRQQAFGSLGDGGCICYCICSDMCSPDGGCGLIFLKGIGWNDRAVFQRFGALVRRVGGAGGDTYRVTRQHDGGMSHPEAVLCNDGSCQKSWNGHQGRSHVGRGARVKPPFAALRFIAHGIFLDELLGLCLVCR